MKTPPLKEIKEALQERNHKELLELCITLIKFKNETKEHLSYLLFELAQPDTFIKKVNTEADMHFSELPNLSFKNKIKKIRKIIQLNKKYIRFAADKNIEVALLVHICQHLQKYDSIYESVTINNYYNNQLERLEKAFNLLNEDLKYDYKNEIENLLNE